MLQVFVNDGGTLKGRKGGEAMAAPLPAETVWIDLLAPLPDALARAEALMGVRLPTREQMAEIEESSRLRRLPGGIQFTVLALAFADTDAPRLAPVSFVLARGRLATLHHVDSKPFLDFRRRAAHQGFPAPKAEAVMRALVDAVVERTASVLRRVAIELDSLAGSSFRVADPAEEAAPRDDHRTLKRLGQAGHLIAKAHESLGSIARMLDFMARGQTGDGVVGKETRRWARAARLDVSGLDEYAHFLSRKVGLVLDTTLGRINVEQNGIVKIVSVLTVALFPPLLVTSVFGMNFAAMPERHWAGGYPLAITLTVLAAVVPLWFFKRRGWL
ncbi:MAG TPA: CorA family divalent cation transporter [Azospirillum sp.]